MTSSSIVKPSAINFFSRSSLFFELPASFCSRNPSNHRLFRRFESSSSVTLFVNFLHLPWLLLLWFDLLLVSSNSSSSLSLWNCMQYYMSAISFFKLLSFYLKTSIFITNLFTVVLKTLKRVSSCIFKISFIWLKFQILVAFSKYFIELWKRRLTSIESNVRFMSEYLDWMCSEKRKIKIINFFLFHMQLSFTDYKIV